ncbi:MAG: FAD-binding oxidoreductase [Halieaceae bacterium]|nr:FAD-binding oxidoreductase [Halieaceae bacterium]
MAVRSGNTGDIVAQLTALLGEDAVRHEASDTLPDITLKPRTTEQVSSILALCNAAGQALVPIGGRTGLVNGLYQTQSELGLSLERMNAVEEIDCENRTMTVQAGCILQVAAEAAEREGLLLPLDLGARGSATIGGNVATNAGGNRVIRYGMMRDMVLGLEVVLADGTVVSSLNKMQKNNTGYDLKHWFIGAEGTLGVVTRGVLRLRSLPISQNTAFLAADDFDSVSRLLRWVDVRTAGTLSAFEVMWPEFYHHITRAGSNHKPPLPHGSPLYVLVETLGSDQQADAENFENMLAGALEEGLVTDAILTRSQSERNALWEIRDDVLELFSLGPTVTFDISLTLDKMEAFVEDVRSRMSAFAQPICVIFGHLGDGNLHVMIGSKDLGEFDPLALEAMLYTIVEQYQGSVSAEHGIGLAKREHLHCSRNEAELELMCKMKRMMDPNNILNPNKILATAQVAALDEPQQ